MISLAVHNQAVEMLARAERGLGEIRQATIELGLWMSSLLRLRQTLVLALVVTLILGGCSLLAPHEDRTHFIVLAPVTFGNSNGAQHAIGQKLSSAAIGLGPVQLPEYLDHPELVIRTSPNGFELSETNRWAEPLNDNFRHVLANDLTNLLGATNIAQYPWYPGSRLDYTVRIQVQRFEADTTQHADLAAEWEIRDAQNDQSLVRREIQLRRPMASAGGDAVAAALSQDVAELAGQIASAITQFEQQRLARSAR